MPLGSHEGSIEIDSNWTYKIFHLMILEVEAEGIEESGESHKEDTKIFIRIQNFPAFTKETLLQA